MANRGAFAPKPVDLWTKACRVLPQIIGAYAVPEKHAAASALILPGHRFSTRLLGKACFILLHCLAKRLFRYAAPNHRADVLIFRSGFL
ncbi:MAG: hypothetical protein ACLUO4_02875 [Christensenellales bacterium]